MLPAVSVRQKVNHFCPGIFQFVEVLLRPGGQRNSNRNQDARLDPLYFPDHLLHSGPKLNLHHPGMGKEGGELLRTARGQQGNEVAGCGRLPPPG